jgi:hypothetical protein
MYVSLVYRDWPDNDQFWFVRYRGGTDSAGLSTSQPSDYVSRQADVHHSPAFEVSEQHTQRDSEDEGDDHAGEHP